MNKNVFSLYPVVRLVYLKVDNTAALRLMFMFDFIAFSVQVLTNSGGHIMFTTTIWKLEAGVTFTIYE